MSSTPSNTTNFPSTLPITLLNHVLGFPISLFCCKEKGRNLSCTRLRVPPVALHVSRYTCRATRVTANFLDFIAFCRCSTGVAAHPLKIMVSHLPPPLCREVSHRNLGLKRCRATRGCRSYSCGCRATLCN